MRHQTSSALVRFLTPALNLISLVYKSLAFWQWKRKSRQPERFPGLFIISVDNLSFGGTGKTPLVIELGQRLKQRGLPFAIVTRGYRSRLEKSGGRVSMDHGVADVGDEAILLKKKFPDQEVLVGKNRKRSLRLLQEIGVKIAILDDGFQSADIAKDFRILLINPRQPYFYLRHFYSLRRHSDCVLFLAENEPVMPLAPATYRLRNETVVNRRGVALAEVDLRNLSFVVFSALGDNRRFQNDMAFLNIKKFVAFRDHHRFQPRDVRRMERLRLVRGATGLLCSEKDFVKLNELGLEEIPLFYVLNRIEFGGSSSPGSWSMPQQKGSFKQHLEDSLFRGLIQALGKTPRLFLPLTRRLLIFFLKKLDRRHAAIIRRNLQIAFPRQSEKERKVLSEAVYRHFVTMFLEIARGFQRRDFSDVLGRAEFHGQEHIHRALLKGRGLILFSAHLGNWEWIPLILSRQLGRKINSIARPMDNPLIEKKVREFRELCGSNVISKQGSLRRILELLAKNEIVLLLIDQNAILRESVFVDFFSRPATMVTIVSQIFLRKGIPVLPLFLHYQGERLVLEAGEALRYEACGNEEQDIRQLTQELAERIEKEIQRHPEQWFWFHDRWRTRPQGDEYEERRETC